MEEKEILEDFIDEQEYKKPEWLEHLESYYRSVL